MWEEESDANIGVVNPIKPSPKSASEKLIPNPILEKAIHEQLKKPTGGLTKAALEKVTGLDLSHNQLTSVKRLEKLDQLEKLILENNQLTDVKGLEKLTKLETLWLDTNSALTKAQIAELQKALPKCKILSNPTKQSLTQTTVFLGTIHHC